MKMKMKMGLGLGSGLRLGNETREVVMLKSDRAELEFIPG